MNTPRRFISTNETLDRVGFSKTHLYRLINRGEFPKPIPLGSFKVAFLEEEVNQWMEKRIEARNQGEGEKDRKQRALKNAGYA